MKVCITSLGPGDGNRLHVFRLDAASGQMEVLGGTRDGVENPLFVRRDPSGRFLYVSDLAENVDGVAGGAISAYEVDRDSGALRHRNRLPSGGEAPCYVDVSRDGRFVLAANYTGGSVGVLSARPDGSLGALLSTVRHEGRGPHADRQEGPHPHCFRFDPENRFAVAADLGIDRVVAYPFDSQTGRIDAEHPVRREPAAAGAGPRHIAFGREGRVAYVINELDNTITAMPWDPVDGPGPPGPVVTTLPEGFDGASWASDLHVHPDGRFVYATNRPTDGDGNIAVFEVKPAGGGLVPIEHVSTRGVFPRACAIDPSGEIMVVGNERSDTVVTFHVDRESGRLSDTGQTTAVRGPACLEFV